MKNPTSSFDGSISQEAPHTWVSSSNSTIPWFLNLLLNKSICEMRTLVAFFFIATLDFDLKVQSFFAIEASTS